MKRIFLHLLLATALILQGAAAAFAKDVSGTTHGPCCPHGTVDGQTHHAKCPCPHKQHCTSDCQWMCAAGVGPLIASPAFVTQLARSSSARPVRSGTFLLPRSDTPPIRPPIG
jgi:hypothetical protein